MNKINLSLSKIRTRGRSPPSLGTLPSPPPPPTPSSIPMGTEGMSVESLEYTVLCDHTLHFTLQKAPPGPVAATPSGCPTHSAGGRSKTQCCSETWVRARGLLSTVPRAQAKCGTPLSFCQRTQFSAVHGISGSVFAEATLLFRHPLCIRQRKASIQGRSSSTLWPPGNTVCK